ARLLKTGERIWNLQKLFNIKRGFGRKDDTLPPRLLNEPLKEGAPAGQVWRRDEMLDEYYRLRGWDKEGTPTPEKRKELDIEGERGSEDTPRLLRKQKTLPRAKEKTRPRGKKLTP
ncbi:MAG: aldehyde ferredoxin oxidoreductase C-terminal domain-containing protein, partial [Methanoregula sp.]